MGVVNYTPRDWTATEFVTEAHLDSEIRDPWTNIQSAWTSYSPTWTAATTNPTIASHTLTGQYQRVGKTIHFRLRVVFGAANFGTGSYIFGLPVPSIVGFNDSALISATLYDVSVPTRNMRVGYLANASTFTLTDAAGANVGSTVPWTWASGDTLAVCGTYEAA